MTTPTPLSRQDRCVLSYALGVAIQSEIQKIQHCLGEAMAESLRERRTMLRDMEKLRSRLMVPRKLSEPSAVEATDRKPIPE